MARANNGGWDFIKVGGTYQYKEDGFLAWVTILEDNSDEEYYRFLLQVERSNYEPPQNGVFEIMNIKGDHGYYSGMLQFYEQGEYSFPCNWIRSDELKDLEDRDNEHGNINY